MQFVIYKIMNVQNGKFYVGSTKNLLQRTSTHRRRLRTNTHHCPQLQAAWNKYGEQAFVFVVVEEVYGEQHLHLVENKWLAAHFGKPYCYNASRCADAPMRGRTGEQNPRYGVARTDETKQKVAEGLRRFYAENPDKHPRLGTKHTEETIEKIRAQVAGKQAGEKHHRYGKKLSPEIRKKIGDAQRGKPKAPGRRVTPEGKAKIAAAAARGAYSNWLGRTHKKEDLQKMRRRVAEITSGQEFESVGAALQHFGMTAPTLNRALQTGQAIGPRSRHAGLAFKYL
jgi:group I intron endonuclease